MCLDDQGSDELDVGVESSARVLHRANQLGSGVHRSNHDRLDHSVGDRRPLRGRLSAVDAFPRLPLSYSSRPPFSSRSSFHPTFQRCQSRDRRPIASSVSVSRFCFLGLNILLRCEVRCGSQLAARVCVCQPWRVADFVTHQRRTRLAVLVVLLTAVLYNVPRHFERQVYYLNCAQTSCDVGYGVIYCLFSGGKVVRTVCVGPY